MWKLAKRLCLVGFVLGALAVVSLVAYLIRPGRVVSKDRLPWILGTSIGELRLHLGWEAETLPMEQDPTGLRVTKKWNLKRGCWLAVTYHAKPGRLEVLQRVERFEAFDPDNYFHETEDKSLFLEKRLFTSEAWNEQLSRYSRKTKDSSLHHAKSWTLNPFVPVEVGADPLPDHRSTRLTIQGKSGHATCQLNAADVEATLEERDGRRWVVIHAMPERRELGRWDIELFR